MDFDYIHSWFATVKFDFTMIKPSCIPKFRLPVTPILPTKRTIRMKKKTPLNIQWFYLILYSEYIRFLNE